MLWLSVFLSVCLSRGFSESFEFLRRKKCGKEIRKLTVSSKLVAVLNTIGLEKEHFQRRIFVRARSRVKFAGFSSTTRVFLDGIRLVLQTGATLIGFSKKNSVTSFGETFKN